MIAYLQGRVIYRDIERSLIILETNGVGYEVYVPVSDKNQDSGKGVSLFIYTYVREDRITLYGFNTTLQREIFALLLNVKDVGPKLAVTILSSIDAANFINILTAQDISALSQIKGIGSAKSERIIRELKNKVLKKTALSNDINAQDLYLEKDINAGTHTNGHNNSGYKTESGRKTGDDPVENSTKGISGFGIEDKFRAGRQTSDIILESARALEVLGYSKLDSFNLASKVFGILKAGGNAPADTEDLMRECLKQIYSHKNS
ncbi:MAG: Holliday junction branch migration protein RuvA [bacterium]